MKLFLLSDLHLSISTPSKTMEIFGPKWKDYHNRIEHNWNQVVTNEDMVLVPGDISWAIDLEHGLVDLAWLDKLAGQKLIIKGNHDYWWESYNKILPKLPTSIHAIYNNSYSYNEIAFAGTRLWDTEEYSLGGIYETEGPFGEKVDLENQEKIYSRELHRLEESLKKMDPNAKRRIVLTHYPPIGLDLKPSRASQLFEKWNVDTVVFGHLHGIRSECVNLFGQARGVNYILGSCDYLNCAPIQII